MLNMKRNLKISLIVLLLLCGYGLYQKLTYTPIQNPVDDVELRVEGVMFTVWYGISFVVSFLVFILLTVITSIVKFYKEHRKIGDGQ